MTRRGRLSFTRAHSAGSFKKWDGPMPYWMITTGPDSEPGINGGLMPARECRAAVCQYHRSGEPGSEHRGSDVAWRKGRDAEDGDSGDRLAGILPGHRGHPFRLDAAQHEREVGCRPPACPAREARLRRVDRPGGLSYSARTKFHVADDGDRWRRDCCITSGASGRMTDTAPYPALPAPRW